MEKTWFNKYPAGVPHEINPEAFKSLVEVFDKSAKKFAKNPSFTCMGKTITFEELDKLSDQFASFLQNHVGLKKGDRIAIQMPNVLQFPVAMFGAMKAGLIIVNTNPLYTAREMKHQFNDSGAKAIVILANFASLLEGIISETGIKTVITTEIGDMLGFPKSLIVNSVVKYVKRMVPGYDLPQAYSFMDALYKGADKPYTPVDISSDDLAFLQYTGGTTGVSKGAMLTHRNIIANMLQVQSWMNVRLEEGKEIIITALPMYHIFSLSVNCMAFLAYGSQNILITNPRDIGGFIKELKKYPFTLMTGVNTLFNALMNHPDFMTIDFSTLKLSVGGAMALQKAVTTRWKEMTKSVLVEGYGLTEASPVLTVNPIDGTDRVGTIGLPVPSTDIRILDEDGKVLGPGHAGELAAFGPQVMKGYWERPDETAKVITPDGWLKTGDMAEMSEDGFFKIVDRKKDMILVSGFNVYPNEIEDVVAHHPKVLEVAAIGVPDEKSGEIVKIYVVKKDPSLTEEELKAHCKGNLTGYKVPKLVEFRTELPKTNVGKILRRTLKEELKAQSVRA